MALAADEAVQAFLVQLGSLSDDALRDVSRWSPTDFGYDTASWNGLSSDLLRLAGDPDPWSGAGVAATAVVELLENRGGHGEISQMVNLARCAVLAIHLREHEDLEDKSISMVYAPFAGAIPLIRPGAVPARVSQFVKSLRRLSYPDWQHVVSTYADIDSDVLDEAVGEAMDSALPEDLWIDALCLEPYGRLCISRAGMPLDTALSSAFDDSQFEAQRVVGENLRRQAYGEWKLAGWVTAEAAGALVIGDRLSREQLGLLYAPFHPAIPDPRPIEGGQGYGPNSAQVQGFLQAAVRLTIKQWDGVLERWAAIPKGVHEVAWDTAREIATGIGVAAAEAVLNAACALLARSSWRTASSIELG